jgi:DNA-binding response OmpR family regulator
MDASDGRVLVVEDDRDILELMEECLHGRCMVELAVDGVEALAILSQRSREFDAMVLDMALPRLDGAALLRELRDRKISVPVLVVSAVPEARLWAREATVEFMPKPFEAERLAEMVDGLIRKRRLTH